MGLACAYREPALRELMLVQELLRGRDVGAVLDVHRQQLIEEILDDLALHEVHLDLANKRRDEEDVAHDLRDVPQVRDVCLEPGAHPQVQRVQKRVLEVLGAAGVALVDRELTVLK